MAKVDLEALEAAKRASVGQLLLKCARLLAWGTRDPAFGEAALARWATALPAARGLRVESAGHWPHEEEPAAVLAGGQGFLEGPGAGRTVTER